MSIDRYHTAKFSSGGHHVVVGTAFGLLYLLPNVAGLLSGLTTLQDTVQKLNVGEPLMDILWEEDNRRIFMRTVHLPPSLPIHPS